MALFNSGERFLPGTGGITQTEHMHRYALAMKLADGLDVLDVASGEGYGSNLLATVARSVVGVDISEEARLHACEKYQKPNLQYLQGDCARLPLESASVDLVVSFETIEHHDQHEAMLSEIRRVLRPDGVLLISSPNRPEYNLMLGTPNPYHVKELDYEELVGLLETDFINIDVYGQYGLNESIILPYDHSKSLASSDFSSGTDHYLQGLRQPVYFIAVVGSGELPSLGTSVYQSTETDKTESDAIALEVVAYLSEVHHGQPSAYSQSRSMAEGYLIDGDRKLSNLLFPNDLRTLAKIRLDMANAPVSILLHTLKLQRVSGEVVWEWDGISNVFSSLNGMLFLPYGSAAYLLCLNDDPQADLDIPQVALRQIRAGDKMVLEFTPEPLMDVLPRVFSVLQDTREKADSHVFVGFPQRIVAGLEDLSGLMKKHIGLKNETISRREAEIEILKSQQGLLHEQLIRAEAQLDLLKDVIISGREEDSL